MTRVELVARRLSQLRRLCLELQEAGRRAEATRPKPSAPSTSTRR